MRIAADRLIDWRCIWVAAAFAVVVPTYGAVDPGIAAAPRTDFVPPAPGTYRLQRIQPVSDATLLDTSGHARRLIEATRGKVTLLTFFYSNCTDPLGCPFAFGTLHRLRAHLSPEPGVRNRVRLVSVSLDPTNDTPQALADYARGLAPSDSIDWQFLTARSVGELLPVLDDFGQDVSVEVNDHGRPTRALHHMLKMFLIDSRGTVREIYSLAFLQPQVIVNDVKTLLMESPAANRNSLASQRP
jgi:protein SCO1